MPRKVAPRHYTPPVDSMIVNNVEITSFEEIRHFDDGRTKTCFRCKSQNGNDRLCVYWGVTTAEVGDSVFMKGRMKPDGTFIVWDMMYKKGVNQVNKGIQPATPPDVKGEKNDS